MAKAIGLRAEILTTLILLIGAALLLGGILMLRLTEQHLLEQKVSQLRLISGVLAHTLGESYSALYQDTPFALKALEQLPAESNHEGWWLYGPDLQLVMAFNSTAGETYSVARRRQIGLSRQALETIEFPSLLQMLAAAKARATFALPLYQQERFVGLLDIRYSLEDIRLRLFSSLRMILLYVLLYGIVLVFSGYYLLQRNLIRPARNLLQATQDVSRGHLETRLPVAGPVEIAQLAEAYNRMVAALLDSRQETQTHISTLEQTNHELQRTRDELIRSEKMASVGQLAAGLAHELGNPLAALIGYLEIFKGAATDDQRDIAERSLVETGRIDALVREFLDYSRPGTTTVEDCDPTTVLRDSLTILANQGTFSGLTVTDLLPPRLANVRMSRQKLQQVFINLLLNASQACGDKGIIQVTAGTEADLLWLEIADNGCGIAEEDLKRIFDPFYTTKDPGQGTGLGLAICHRIIEEAGGVIDVVSTAGRGSHFTLSLPISQ